MAEAIHSFSELATEVKKAIDQEDVAVLENIEDNVELTSTAVRAHALNTYLIYNKKRYKVIQSISIGDTLTVGTNIQLASDLTAELGETKDEIDSLKEVVTEQINENGAKNLLDVTARARAGKLGSTFSYSGQTIIVNGTETGGGHVRLFPIEDDNSYVLPAGNYVLSGQSSDNDITFTLRKNGTNLIAGSSLQTPFEFSANGTDYFTFLIRLTAKTYSNATVTAMICLKSTYDLDPTYEPYAKTNQQLTEDTTGLIDNQNVNGAVNSFENTASSIVQSEVTWTVNSNKTVTATVSSTVASLRVLNFVSNSTIPHLEHGKTYRLTGSNTSGCRTFIYDVTSGAYAADEQGAGANFTYDSSHRYNMGLAINQNVAAGTYVFKPMISLASLNLNYDDYVPYADTNKGLTDRVANLESGVSSLKSMYFSIPANSSKTITFTSISHFILTTSSTGSVGSDVAALYIGAGKSDALVGFAQIKAGTRETLSSSANGELVIANSHTSSIPINLLLLDGNATIS